MKKLLGKKGLLILLGAVILLAGLTVQVGIAHSIRAEMNAGADRMDLRAFYETLTAPYKLLMVSGFFAVPVGLVLAVVGLILPRER